MPIPANHSSYDPAPPDVDDYLRIRGWYPTGSNLWAHTDPEINNSDFQWPEALAYEIFRNFVLLKAKDE